jgi:uncharacterized protein YcbK (DUF882 family)
MISRSEVLMGRDKDAPLDAEQEKNLEELLIALNKLRKAYGKPMIVSSGYRPPSVNKAVGGAKKSSHMSCQACDFKDSDGSLADWCLKNLDVLIDCGLYLESPAHTIGWVHVQTRPTKNRVFIP